MTHRANLFATMTRRPKYGAPKQLPHSFSLVGEEMGGAEPSRAPSWECSRCGGAPPLGSHDRCLTEAEADGPQASSRPPFATPRALPHAPLPLLFYFSSPSRRCPEGGRRHTERAAACRRLRAKIRCLPPSSKLSASSPSGSLSISTPTSGSLRISTPTSSASSPVDHEVAWPKLGADAARRHELVKDDRRWQEGAAWLRWMAALAPSVLQMRSPLPPNTASRARSKRRKIDYRESIGDSNS
jgi:hypothetical protein